MVIELTALLDTLLTGKHPVEEIREPSLQGLCVTPGKGFRALQQLHGIEHLDEGIAIDDAVATAFAIIETWHYLGIVQMGIHPGGLVEEPHAQPLRSLGSIALVTAEEPSQRERRHTRCHLLQPDAVEFLQFRIRHTVTTDVWQPVGLGRVGPEIAAQTQVIVFVATDGRLFLHHHGEGFLPHAVVCIRQQPLIGRSIGWHRQRLLHSGEVRPVPDGLRTRRLRH